MRSVPKPSRQARLFVFAAFLVGSACLLYWMMRPLALGDAVAARDRLEGRHSLDRLEAVSLERGAGSAADPSPPFPGTRVRPAEPVEAARWIQIVSAVDQRAIADARARILTWAENREELRVDAQGRLPIVLTKAEAQHDLILIAAADGFCRRMLRLPPTTESTLVGLQPSGDLRISLTDELGAPVAGVELQLLPPDARGAPWQDEWKQYRPRCLGMGPEALLDRLSRAGVFSPRELPVEFELPFSTPEAPALELRAFAGHILCESFRDCFPQTDWIRRTDAEGVARWQDLPALEGYRWGALAVAVIEHEPEPSVVRATNERGGLHYDSREQISTEISGPFELKVGEERQLEGQVARLTGVFGVFPEAEPVAGARVVVKIMHRSSKERERAQGYAEVLEEQSLWAATDGSFLAQGIKPGSKYLRAWWREEGEHIYIYDQPFELEPGEPQDLGALYARQGVSLVLRADLVGRSKTALNPAIYLKDPLRNGLHLGLHGRGTVAGLRDSVDLSLTMGLAKDTTIHGLPYGECSLWLNWDFEPEEVIEAFEIIERPEFQTVSTRSETRVDLPIRVERDEEMVECLVQARFPAGAPVVRGEAHFLFLSDARAFSTDLRVREGDHIEGSLFLPRGRHHLCAHTHAIEEPQETSSYVFSAEVEVVDGEPIVVPLVPGATIEGVARDANGALLAQDSLWISALPFLGHEPTHFTHKAGTGGDGRFRVRGLSPDTFYRSRAGAHFTTGAAGVVTQVELSW